RLKRFLTGYEHLSPAGMLELLADIDDAVDELPDYLDCARELAALPSDVAAALRSNEWMVDDLEAAAAHRTFDDVLRQQRGFARFGGRELARKVRELDRLTSAWQQVNSRVLCDRVTSRFVEHVRISTMS